ncbi:MAG TPA: hypothetical protein VNU68_02010 [Verrucomicrobiae bacterium]|nr:hypothetical protein [Verrucomicrobiae bacterium]
MDLYLCLFHNALDTPIEFGLVLSDHEPKDDELIRALDFPVPVSGERITTQKMDEREIKTLPFVARR